ncbi:hypothetical protein EGW08_011377 [Elysia chlorotica]|uniref:Translocon-associated protein subunit alpha n=1 Tax=Elysia chlorotica TaxID=188477 RepID=A0A3S0ZK98_ELYCH|nr:hypothetical protein EGW08_011377 [Elysia chlorotica]
MAKIFGNFLLLLFLILPAVILLCDQGKGSNLAFAQDAMEGEDEDGTIETEAGAEEEASEDAQEAPLTDQEEDEVPSLKPSPDADTYILFTKPSNPLELPAGKQVRILVGFTNKGNMDFTVENMEASFRYPQDYTFFLQNFTAMTYNSVIEPQKQGTFEYGFIPNEAFSSRPFGLSVILNYKDAEGAVFQSAVFNETVQVVEPDEGLDGETFFLYVFLAAIVVLLLVGVQQLVSNFGRKRLTKPRQPVEMGTQNSDVDYDWLPKETLQSLNKSPKRSPKPKQSPRQRRNLRSSGSGDD